MVDPGPPAVPEHGAPGSADRSELDFVDEILVPQRRPWVRMWARSFDYQSAYPLPVLLLAILVGPQQLPSVWLWLIELEPPYLWAVFGLSVAISGLSIEAYLLSTWGTTPGKWLLNIRVRHTSGRKLSYREALKRAAGVLYRGQALGIPPFTIIAQIVAYNRLIDQGTTSWDHQGAFVVRHRRVGATRVVVYIVLSLVLSANYEGLHELASLTTAEAFFEGGEYAEAATAYQRAIEINPDDADTYWYLARTYSRQELYEEAVETLQAGAELAPQDPDFPLMLTQLHLQMGSYDESLREAHKLAGLAPEATLAEAYDKLGDAFLWNAQPDEAVHAYREALARKEGLVSTRGDLAFALLLADELEAAVEQFEAYQEQAQKPVIYWLFWHSLTLRRLGRDSDAWRLLRDSSSEPGSEWERGILRYLLDELSAEELVRRAEGSGELSEAHFYVGYQALIEGDGSTASESFRETIAAGSFGFYEHAGAAIELRKLDRLHE